MRRVEAWHVTLLDVIVAYETREAKYGTSDCCCFVRDCVEAMTGEDILIGFPMKYSSAAGALKELVKFGKVKTPEALMDTRMNETCELTYARRGDIISREVKGDDAALGICVGRDSLFMHITRGLVRVPTLTCSRAWKV